MEPASQASARTVSFNREMRLWLDDEQMAWLEEEASRRRGLLRVGNHVGAFRGLDPRAHGGNHHINKGTILRNLVENARNTGGTQQ